LLLPLAERDIVELGCGEARLPRMLPQCHT
jgi:hypothetical protein